MERTLQSWLRLQGCNLTLRSAINMRHNERRLGFPSVYQKTAGLRGCFFSPPLSTFIFFPLLFVQSSNFAFHTLHLPTQNEKGQPQVSQLCSPFNLVPTALSLQTTRDCPVFPSAVKELWFRVIGL